MINRACVFSDRPSTSQIEEQKFLRLDLCTLKLTQKIRRSRVEVLKLIRLSDVCYDRIPEFERSNLSTV